MELNFEQVNGAYVASVKVDSAYALHLERAGRCPLAVLQRHGEAGQYVPCPLPAVTGSLAPAVVDVALDHCVYPVEVKIVSGLEPHVSTLTPYAGGGGGGGIPDAPQDGVLYGRKDGTWSAVPDPSGDIADLQGRMDTAEGDIDALQQADAAQDGRLDALEAADTQLGERLAAAEGKITTAEGDIAALEGRMDTAEGEIDALQTADTQQDEKITALETAQTQQGQRLTAAEGEIDDLQTADAAQDTKITALETAQTQQGQRLATAEGEIDDLTGRVTTLEDQGGGGGADQPVVACPFSLQDLMDTTSDELQTLLGDGLFEKLVAAGEANGYAAMVGAGTGAVLARLNGSTASSSIQLTGSDATNYPTVRSYSFAFTKLNGTVSRGQSIIYNETLPVILMMNTSAYAVSRMSPEQVETTFSSRFDELFSAAGSGWPLIMGGASEGTEKRPVLYRMQRIGSGESRSIQLDATDTEAYPTVYAATVFVNNEGGAYSNSGTSIRAL